VITRVICPNGSGDEEGAGCVQSRSERQQRRRRERPAADR